MGSSTWRWQSRSWRWLVIAIGVIYAVARSWSHRYRATSSSRAMTGKFRARLGNSLLIGLEILVAADIIRTVALEPSLENVAILGILVLVRTFLSWSLVVEIEGRWPWRAAAGRGNRVERIRRRGRDRSNEPRTSDIGLTGIGLIDAAAAGDLDGLRALFETSELDLNVRDARGRTALMAATYANQPAAVDLLLRAGADVDLQDDMLNNPFLYSGR